MEWLNILLGGLVALFGGLNVFQFIFLRSTKKEYQAKAEQASIEATDARFESLQKQINDMETLYRSQGETLKQVREELLEISKKKMESDQRVAQLEMENETLKTKVEKLEHEIEAYKIINGNGK